MAVTKNDISASLRRLGIGAGDTVLMHSSLKSAGHIEGGADTVIDALLACVGEDGTVVVPTFAMLDFQNAYNTWYPDKPSETGYITEVFRKRPNALRSNQATHSVAAIGKDAAFLTCTHGENGLRFGLFGNTPFSHDSPWQKLYDMHAIVLLFGVDMTKNTMKHLLEYMIVESTLQKARKSGTYDTVFARLRLFETRLSEDPIWVFPHLQNTRMEEIGEKEGIMRRTTLGNAQLTAFGAYALGEAVLSDIAAQPEKWYPEKTLQWFADAEK